MAQATVYQKHRTLQRRTSRSIRSDACPMRKRHAEGLARKSEAPKLSAREWRP